MCALCRKEPCDSRCPNAPDPEPVYRCIVCGGGIFQGDRYWDSPDGAICDACVGGMSGKEVLEIMEEGLEEAREER